MSESRRDWAWRRQIAAAAISIAFLLPLVFMVSGSLRQPGLPPPRSPELLPRDPSLESYRQAFALVDLARYTANSLLVAALVVPLSVLVASWAGFAMTRLSERQARALMASSLVALMVPLTALLVPRFTIFRALSGAANVQKYIDKNADLVAAIVFYDDPAETSNQYAPYKLTVNGVTQPGGGM